MVYMFYTNSKSYIFQNPPGGQQNIQEAAPEPRGQKPELQLHVLHHVLLVNAAAEEITVHHLVVNRCRID